MSEMKLLAKQMLFTDCFSRLIQYARDCGYEAVIETVYRPGDPLCHGMKLAGDLSLFVNGEYITDGLSKPYSKLGEWWKQQHELCRWGGDFTGKNKGDGNHFSITHNGKA